MSRSLILFPFLIACWGPTSGRYVFETTGTSGDCESTDDTGGGSDNQIVDITVSDEGTAVRLSTWNPPEGDPKVCPLDGNVFTCTMELVVDLTPSMAATATYFLEIEGGWTSGDAMKGQTTYSNTCQGADCETAFGAALCSGESTWTATLQDE